MEQNVDNMRKHQLMQYAQSLGVATRKIGTTIYRAVHDVRQDCKAQQERSRAHAGEPGSASSGAAVRSASHGPALAQTLSADTVEPGSGSSSQAQVTSPASGRMTGNLRARAVGIAASDVRNMNKADLRTLATSLGVSTRDNRKSMDTLRETCVHAVQGQRGIAAYLQPASGSPGDLGLQVAGQVGGVAAPVSDSASAVEPRQTILHKRARIPVRPSWLCKAWNSRHKAVRGLDPRYKARDKARDLLPQRKARDKARDLLPHRKARGHARDLLPKRKARDKARDQRPERGKAHAKRKAKRYQLDFTERAIKQARKKKHRQQAAQRSAKVVVPKSARADRTGVLGREGSWKRTADESARLCQQDGPSHMPPCYAGLHQELQRKLTSEMCGCLEEVQWATCVVCWRAWYDLPADYEFSCKQRGLRSTQTPWFDPSGSVVTRARKRGGAVNQWRLEAVGSVGMSDGGDELTSIFFRASGRVVVQSDVPRDALHVVLLNVVLGRRKQRSRTTAHCDLILGSSVRDWS